MAKKNLFANSAVAERLGFLILNEKQTKCCGGVFADCNYFKGYKDSEKYKKIICQKYPEACIKYYKYNCD